MLSNLKVQEILASKKLFSTEDGKELIPFAFEGEPTVYFGTQGFCESVPSGVCTLYTPEDLGGFLAHKLGSDGLDPELFALIAVKTVLTKILHGRKGTYTINVGKDISFSIESDDLIFSSTVPVALERDDEEVIFGDIEDLGVGLGVLWRDALVESQLRELGPKATEKEKEDCRAFLLKAMVGEDLSDEAFFRGISL